MSSPAGRLIFAGSPEFAVPALAALADTPHTICAVLTQPDRPAGRGQQLRESPVKRAARARDLPVWQPASLRRDPATIAALAALQADLMVVVAYGLILPPEVLAIPRRGCVNLHASLLPRWRGAAPIQAALLAGDAETGVTLMQLEAGLDTGPMLGTVKTPIGPQATAAQLHDLLAQLGAELLIAKLAALLAGTLPAVPQPIEGATYAHKLTKADARLDWREPALVLQRRIRAFQPWPVAETSLDGCQLRCWAADVLASMPAAAAPPGTILAVSPAGIDVQTGSGVLRLTSVQLAGRQRLPAGEFARGHALQGKTLA